MTNARIIHHIKDTVELYETMIGGLVVIPGRDIGNDKYSNIVSHGLRNLFRERVIALKTAAHMLEYEPAEAETPAGRDTQVI